ncbi:M13 family metallopeptidase [Rhodococcus marinonascens]|uniref:M13 family metallopeptidase n=1 Tax=Rhodococcus marinonascens TaxID=38311 RepID=UPI0014750C28|nr:M13 family metallopeptidase [Rhodococcus marinonascens]
MATGAALTIGVASCSSTDVTDRTNAAFDTSELDTGINPCDDFNGFVNGQWSAQTQIPDDESSYGVINQLRDESLEVQRGIADRATADLGSADENSDRRKIGLLFESAMDERSIDEAGFSPISSTLDQVDSIASPADVVTFLREDAEDGGALLFGLTSGADFQDATKQIGFVEPTGISLPSKDYYTDPQYASILDGYRNYLRTSLELIGVDDAQASAQADQALDFEKELAAASLSPEQARDPATQYKLVTVDEANVTMPEFDWRQYFVEQNVSPDEGFSLADTAYFTQVDQLLANAPIEQWKSYLRAQVVSRSADSLSKPFRDNKFEFDKQITGNAAQKDRWKVAIADVNSAMGEAMGRLYVAEAFDPAAKQRAEQLVGNVLDALKARIENVDWMSPETKQQAVDKWSELMPKIGYPDTWRDWSGLQINQDDYFGNLAAADKFNHVYDLAKIGKPSDRADWVMTPQTVNAYYSPNDNTINFPAAILQAPFFDPNADDALNYGGIGSVIGHEATHAFDDQGSQFDGKGNHVNWWTPADTAQFDSRTGKLVDQYDAYTPIPGMPDVHVNGNLTLGENIADLGGVNASYDALQTVLDSDPGAAAEEIGGYTPSQRFFLNYARVWRDKTRDEALLTQISSDPHSPASLRVNGVVANVPGFAEAFGCVPGAPEANVGDQLVAIW